MAKTKGDSRRRKVRRPAKKRDLGPALLAGDDKHIAAARKLGPDARVEIPANERYKPSTRTVSKGRWTAPEGMPTWQAMLCCAGLMCGAVQRSYVTPEGTRVYGVKPDGVEGTQLYCRQKPSKKSAEQGSCLPRRCRSHGGTVPAGADSPLRGNKHNLIHGLYSRAILPGEEEAWEQFGKEMDLKDEIRLCKLRLARAARALRKQEEELASGRARLRTSRIEKERGLGPQGAVNLTKRRRVLPDFQAAIHRLINELTRLVTAQLQIEAAGSGAADPREVARKVRELVAEMDSVHVPEGGEEE